jgi:hypothetical protein
MPKPTRTLTLAAGTPATTTVKAGSLRGVNLTVTSPAQATLKVTVKDAAGSVLAANTRSVTAGSGTLPVPLAADPGVSRGQVPSGSDTIDVSSNVTGVRVGADAGSRVWVQAIRPSPSDSQVRMAYAGDNLMIYERLDYAPRIHFATHASVIPDDAARLNAVTHSPLQADQVILGADPPQPMSETALAARSVSVQEDSGDTIRVRVDTSAAGYLVVTDSLIGNFDATVDGHPATLVPADYAGGGVYVGAGTHEVTLSYAPTGESSGRLITIASVLVLIVFGTWPWWLRLVRRPRHRPSKHAVATSSD